MDTHTIPHMITNLKDQLFGIRGYRNGPNSCFILTLDIGVDDLGYAKDGSTPLHPETNDRRGFYFVFSNNTTVFAYTALNKVFPSPKELVSNIDLYKFEHLSDHDSCWRGEVQRYIFGKFHDMYTNVSVHRRNAAEKVRMADYQPFLWSFKLATGTLIMERRRDDRPILKSVEVDKILNINVA